MPEPVPRLAPECGFVLAVCGSEAHLGSAERAAGLLRARTRHPVHVLTDPKRNVRPLRLPGVIEVATPAEHDDHRAAIWMKTRLHRLLPAGPRYCYLDSDVLAVGERVDTIFDCYTPPVGFASDRTSATASIKRFGKSAYRCDCLAEHAAIGRHFARLERFVAEHRTNVDFAALDDPAYYEGATFRGRLRHGRWWHGEARATTATGATRFVQEFEGGEQVRLTCWFEGNPWRWEKAAAWEPAGLWRADDGASFHWVADESCAPGGYWVDQDGRSFRQPRDGGPGVWHRGDAPLYRLERQGEGSCWVDGAGNRIPEECDHLAEALSRELGVTVAQPRWLQWNGGVFVFGPESTSFLDLWHELTGALLARPGWAVRDQGALVAAAWRAGLQDHPRLPQRFNLICDRRALEPGDWTCAVADVERGDAQLLHFIGGGIGDASWSLWREVSARLAGSAEPRAAAQPSLA